MKFPILRTISLAAILVHSSVAADDQSESGTFLPLETNFMCGVRVATGFILGGKDAKRGEFPFIAALGYRSSQGRKSIACTGIKSLFEKGLSITDVKALGGGVNNLVTTLLRT